ncbi:hypothetical protein JTB14_025853 [Gonioctena quinquepunctata]|nr:hypothetical protein JTB14_025853 [Gonioctena quinquepunctata]
MDYKANMHEYGTTHYSLTSNPERLTGRHFTALVPNHKVRRCTVCSQSELRPKKRRESRYSALQPNCGMYDQKSPKAERQTFSCLNTQ